MRGMLNICSLADVVRVALVRPQPSSASVTGRHSPATLDVVLFCITSLAYYSVTCSDSITTFSWCTRSLHLTALWFFFMLHHVLESDFLAAWFFFMLHHVLESDFFSCLKGTDRLIAQSRTQSIPIHIQLGSETVGLFRGYPHGV